MFIMYHRCVCMVTLVLITLHITIVEIQPYHYHCSYGLKSPLSRALILLYIKSTENNCIYFYNIVSTFGQFYQFNNHIILVFELKNIVAWSIDSPSSLVYLPGRPVSAPSDVHARDIIQRLWVNVFLAKFDYLLLWIIFIINWVKNWNLELIITPSQYQPRKASSNITAS